VENLKFSEFEMSKDLKKAVQEMGFEEATQIQILAIPEMLKGYDVIGQAQTGTGKTAAFGIPILEKVNPHEKYTQALIMCPTRELAVQVAEQMCLLGKYIKGLRAVPVYGGQPIDRQIRALKAGAQVIIGTPGRLIDHINRGTVKLDMVNLVVLDEADEMLDMGFIDDIEFILSNVPKSRQTALFSATMPESILMITKNYQKDPKFITVVREMLTADGIDQVYYEVKKGAKLDAISRVMDVCDFKSVLMFCNTKVKVDQITERLKIMGYLAEALHGDKSQAQREKVMSRFKNGQIEILVATDVAARGLDVSGLDAVINYHVPQDLEYYVHRIGRTGRAGKKGMALSFIYGSETHKIHEIEEFVNVAIRCEKVPSVEEFAGIESGALYEKIKEVLDSGKMCKYIIEIEKLMLKNISALDAAAALLKISSLGESRQDDLNHDEAEEQKEKPKYNRDNMDTLFVNLGREDRIEVRDILGAIAGQTGVPISKIGRIDIKSSHTYVDIDRESVEIVIEKMKEGTIKGKRVQIDKVH
jgi:ATP-dependent RNA helicase DeaD